MSLGDNIRRFRRLQNLSQSQLADLININAGYISRIENGKQIPSISSLNKIVKILNCSYDDILFEDTNPDILVIKDLTRDQLNMINSLVREIRKLNTKQEF